MTAGETTSTIWQRFSGLLSHPLAGTHPARTALGIGWVVSVLVAVMAAHWLPLWLLGDERNRELASTLDGLISVVIVLALLSLILAVGYAFWNGGPVLSAIIALGPVFSGTLASGGLAVEVDLVLAVSASALASTVATYTTGVRATDGWRPQPYPGFSAAIAVCAFLLALGVTALVRLSRNVASHADAGLYAGAALLLSTLLVGAGILASIDLD